MSRMTFDRHVRARTAWCSELPILLALLACNCGGNIQTLPYNRPVVFGFEGPELARTITTSGPELIVGRTQVVPRVGTASGYELHDVAPGIQVSCESSQKVVEVSVLVDTSFVAQRNALYLADCPEVLPGIDIQVHLRGW